jgi:hypothetical protein
LREKLAGTFELEAADKVIEGITKKYGNAWLSEYGKTKPAEAYAEAWADWVLNKGITDNKITNAMAKAAEGNTAALGKLGLGLSSAQLKTMSMDQITAKLADTFENQASAKADTFQGKLTRLQIAFDEGKETVGAYILTAITPMVELIVNKVIPAIQDFTSNLGEKLAPVMKIIKPIIDGVKSAFDSVSGSLKENNDELQPFFGFMKAIYHFAKDYLAPVIGETLGFAFKALGKIISTLIDQFSNMVSLITGIYNKIKSLIDLIKGAGSAVGNFFSGASFSSPSSGGTGFVKAGLGSIPSVSAIDESDNRLRASAGITNITVNGAIDPESTARQIVGLLNDSSARGTLGSSGLVFA